MKTNANIQTSDHANASKIYSTLTETMIDLMEGLKTNPTRWEKPWIKTENGLGAHNAISKRPYSGINQLYLSFICQKNEYTWNRWLTFHQAKDLGGRIKHGSKSAMIVFYKQVQAKDQELPQPAKELEEPPSMEEKPKWVLSYYHVFNVGQIDGLPESYFTPYTQREILEIEQIRDAERIVDHCGVQIEYRQQDAAYYKQDQDLVCLPLRTQFLSTPKFYHVLFHEMGHWTGHPDRLNRKLFNQFGSEDYAREELTAEMCSVFVNSLCGIDVPMVNSAVYIDGWLEVLKKDKKSFIRSCLQAQAATNYLLKNSGMEHLKLHTEVESEPV